ncbi:hypothetical protein ACRALDRAFT_1094459 [Sodiomyces alcalophilus JCM 7366]|uniref:uncharacterized protein n=1 Tax=Sodiomyces alcalophilus JCM 7366 TaxID=591952 RepID=UPI0039B4899B
MVDKLHEDPKRITAYFPKVVYKRNQTLYFCFSAVQYIGNRDSKDVQMQAAGSSVSQKVLYKGEKISPFGRGYDF